jgi:hypothetical protein
MLSLIISCNPNGDNKASDIKALSRKEKDPQQQNFDSFIEGTVDSTTALANNAVDYYGDQVEDKKQEEPPQQQQVKKQPSQQPAAKSDWDKKIIKTAFLNAEVTHYDSFYMALREKVRSVGGYIADEAQSQSEYKIENTIVVKVPVDQFDDAVGLLMAGTKKINDKRISSQDVTTEIVDTKSRMDAKKQVRLRYMDLLQQARNMQEILSVQSEINGVQEEIESAAGRIQYLGHSSAFSTINLTYYEILNAVAKDKDKSTFSTRISDAFSVGWNWVGDLFLGLLTIWPLILLVFTIVVIYKKNKAKWGLVTKKEVVNKVNES